MDRKVYNTRREAIEDGIDPQDIVEVKGTPAQVKAASDQKKKEAAGLIAAVVTVLQGALRSVDRIYRIEDDVFIVVLPETNAEQAQVPLGRIREGLMADDVSSTGPVSLTASLVSTPDPQIHSERDILRHLTDQLREVRPEAKDQLIEKP